MPYKDPEKRRENSRKWSKNNKDKIREKGKIYRKKYAKELLERNKKYRNSHPEKQLYWNMRHWSKIGKEFNMDSTKFQLSLISWSKAVKKRDKKCLVCGYNKNLNAHHILYKKYYPQLALNIRNGITLCKKCHEELHGFKIYP